MFRKMLFALIVSSLAGVSVCLAQETTLRGTWQFEVPEEDGRTTQYTVEILRETATSLTYRLYTLAEDEVPVLAAGGFIVKDRAAAAQPEPLTYRLTVPGAVVGHEEALSFEGRTSDANDLLDGMCRQGSRTFACQMTRIGEGN